jgi:hypothetical protein
MSSAQWAARVHEQQVAGVGHDVDGCVGDARTEDPSVGGRHDGVLLVVVLLNPVA